MIFFNVKYLMQLRWGEVFVSINNHPIFQGMTQDLMGSIYQYNKGFVLYKESLFINTRPFNLSQVIKAIFKNNWFLFTSDRQAYNVKIIQAVKLPVEWGDLYLYTAFGH